jgi:hypothetical protein
LAAAPSSTVDSKGRYLEIEIVLLCSGLVSAFGTTGVMTALEVLPVEAKDRVRTDDISVGSAPEALETMTKAIRDMSVDYIDGILYSPSAGVVCLGRPLQRMSSRLRTP